jgi:hypothetical protein
MGKAYLDRYETMKVLAIAKEHPNEPGVIWATLEGMGDQYAKAAFQGITNPNSFYGHVIANSNMLSGVSDEQIKAYKAEVAKGYVALLEEKYKNSPSGEIRLPTSTEIETNYYNAAKKVGVPALSAIDLSVAVLAQRGYILNDENWFKKMHGMGVDLDPLRWGPPSHVLSEFSASDAMQHFLSTGALATAGMTFDELFGAKGLNHGEEEWLKAARAGQQFLVGPGMQVREPRYGEAAGSAPQVNGLPWQRGLAPGEKPGPQDELQVSPGTAEHALDPHQRYQSPVAPKSDHQWEPEH